MERISVKIPQYIQALINAVFSTATYEASPDVDGYTQVNDTKLNNWLGANFGSKTIFGADSISDNARVELCINNDYKIYFDWRTQTYVISCSVGLHIREDPEVARVEAFTPNDTPGEPLRLDIIKECATRLEMYIWLLTVDTKEVRIVERTKSGDIRYNLFNSGSYFCSANVWMLEVRYGI